MAITTAQQKALANLARAANRRLERATEGQRSALEHNIKGYNVRSTASGDLAFKQGKAKTEAEYRQRMQELEKFMGAETSTRKGWDNLKQRNTAKANRKFNQQGSPYAGLTDEELANVFKETGGSKHGKNAAAFYKALENVIAAKLERMLKEAEEGSFEEEDFDHLDEFTLLSEDEIIEEVNDRRTDMEKTDRLLKAREEAEEAKQKASQKKQAPEQKKRSRKGQKRKKK